MSGEPFSEMKIYSLVPPDVDMGALVDWLAVNVRFGMCDVITEASTKARTLVMTVVPPIGEVTYPPGPNYTPPGEPA